MNFNFILISLAIFLVRGEINAQKIMNLKENQEFPETSIQDLKWIAGYWEGTGLGGQCEELWFPPADNSMIGTFRFFMEGVLIFSEYMHIIEEDGKIFLKLKHFNRDLSPWEEKETWTIFPFIKSEGQTAYFDGLTFQREGDEMVLLLSMGSNGEKRIEEFQYKKSRF